MLVTSGVRSLEQHLAIYKKMGRQAPKGSAHLTGAAVDFADRDGALSRWCVEHVKDLQTWGLYMEDPSATPTWTHLQVTPPASGNTIFVPFIKAAKK